MKKMLGRAGLLLAACLLLLLGPGVPGMAATPTTTYPCLFYGTAEVDNEAVAAGTEITGWVGDEQVGSAITGEEDLADNQFSVVVELESEAEVSFKIGELTADETATWVKFGSVEVNLTATTGGPTYPCLFYGTASVDDEAVAAGTEITGWVEGEEVASALTGEGDLADNEFSLTVELERAAEVSFKIGQLTANETATWVKFGSVEVNLTAATTGGPTYPCLFYGTASVDNESVAAGAEITAWVPGEQVGSAITGEEDLADNQFSVVVELESEAEVSFKIGQLTANETATWVKFGSVQVNLTATTALPPAGGGPGGGPGAAPAVTTVTTTVFGTTVSFRISDEGEIQSTIEATSEDGMLTMTVPEGTTALDEDGDPLSTLTSDVDVSPPSPPEDASIIELAYDFGPDGATFSPPITLEYTYDPAEIPEGVAEADLVLAYYDEDAAEWVELDCVVDTENDTITASVEHFTVFAIIARLAPAPAPALFSVSNLSVKPAEIEPKEAVTIAVSVANTGGTEGSYTVVLKVNDVKEEEKSVTLAAGGSEIVSFSVAREETGSYSVTVDGLSASFTVAAPPEEEEEVPAVPAKGVNWPLLGGIIGGVIVLGLLIFFLVRRRAA